jgi:hypothetical protein
MNQNNIVEIAQTIQDSIKEYQLFNPDCKSQEKAEEYAMKRLMRLGCGRFNPVIIGLMIKLERSVYTPDTNLRI